MDTFVFAACATLVSFFPPFFPLFGVLTLLAIQSQWNLNRMRVPELLNVRVTNSQRWRMTSVCVCVCVC